MEDGPSILSMTQAMLEKTGYTVHSATTPEEAIKKAQNYAGAIDPLMTDVVMPGMNCQELAEQNTALHPDIRPLFKPGYTADISCQQEVLDDEMIFIQKPFSMATLTEKLRAVLDTNP